MIKTNALRLWSDHENANLLCNGYKSGHRDFPYLDLQAIAMQGCNLSYANLRGANFKRSDLSKSNLKGIDLSKAHLNSTNLRNVDLRGALLHHATLAWASLSEANLQGADLSGASFDAANLCGANLQGADLSGAYLRGAELSEANLNGAYFSSSTSFDTGFDPYSVGMRTTVDLMVEDLLAHLNALSKCSSRYLGNTIVSKYWENARPSEEWLMQFVVDRSGKWSYAGPATQVPSVSQLRWIQIWLNQFIDSCSHIFQDFPDIADQKNLLIVAQNTDQYY
jgi:uncharacterized protein YjbI with pentapeptide repeats